jgi:tetratricopeptide (TPR) repeat protein
MKSIVSYLLLALCMLATYPALRAQPTGWPSPEVEQLYRQGHNLLTQGNFRQAEVSLRQALQLAPQVPEVRRDLAQAYQLGGKPAEALDVLKPILENGRADVLGYLVASRAYTAQRKTGKSFKILEQGLEQHPNSGILYHELGLQHERQANPTAALKAWLQGITQDPAFRTNYYDAARMYVYTDKVVWTIIYGEMFVNMEQVTPRANETRKMLLAAYKRLYFAPEPKKRKAFWKRASVESDAEPSDFEQAVRHTLMQLAPLVSDGVSAENLTMLRTRFMMEWHQRGYDRQYPFGLFGYMDALLREGYFDAYNQWLFGRAENEQQYQAWNRFHEGAMNNFVQWQKAHPMPIRTGEQYNDRVVKGIFPKM